MNAPSDHRDDHPDQDGADKTVMFDLRAWDDVTADELARSHSYPQLRALITGADPDSAAGRVGSDALALQIEDPHLYTETDAISEIAEWMTPAQIAQDRQVLGYGPLYDALGEAAALQRLDVDQTAAGDGVFCDSTAERQHHTHRAQENRVQYQDPSAAAEQADEQADDDADGAG